MVELLVDPNDRRTSNVYLSALGLEKLISALPYWQAAQEQMLAGLGESFWQEMRSSLRLSIDVARTVEQNQQAGDALAP